MMKARPRALLGLGITTAGIVGLALSGNLSIHETRFAVFYGLSLAGFALLATVLYLLCPAVIVQTWDAAHFDSVAVFFVVTAAALLVRRRDTAAGVALGVAAAFRLTPVGLLVPALIGGRAKPARLRAGFIPAFAIPYVPYLATGGATGSLFEAGTGWTGQAFLFAPLARLTGPEAARVFCAAVALTGAVWIARRLRGRELTAPAFAWTLSLLVVCLPVAHAWYWLAPLALSLAAGIWLPVVVGLVAPIPEAFPFTWPTWLPPWRQALGPILLLRRSAGDGSAKRTAVVRSRDLPHTVAGPMPTEGPP